MPATPERPVNQDNSIPADVAHRHPAVLWVLTAAIVLLCVIEGARLLDRSTPQAMAQSVLGSGARGTFAFTGQITKSTYGVYMVDVDAGTMWLYEYDPAKGCLRLAAARTWRYDRYLENLNNCPPSPEDVEELIETQRKYKLQSQDPDTP